MKDGETVKAASNARRVTGIFPSLSMNAVNAIFWLADDVAIIGCNLDKDTLYHE